jgi:hypothetical protein
MERLSSFRKLRNHLVDVVPAPACHKQGFADTCVQFISCDSGPAPLYATAKDLESGGPSAVACF